MGGVVWASIDPFTGMAIGPIWVWTDDRNQAGLAMSWSIGDENLKSIGVIAEPEIWEIELKE